jgi:anthranilate phosphoribosyltransferase
MGERSWPQLISALMRSEDLSTADAAWAMDEVMSGAATPVQIAGFVIALRAKGETAAEVAGLAGMMLDHAVKLDLPDAVRDNAVDIVGTGGDQAHTVNISTMSAIVVAGAGIAVVKHGNRAASSTCGAADLLEHFGIPLDLSPADVAACVHEVGIGFCFAPVYHSGLRHAGVTRRELGVPTVFNVLGPLTNPGRPRSAAIGCANLTLAPVLADVFAGRGDSALVMRGEDGLDEFTTTGPTRLWVAAGGTVRQTVISEGDLGIARSAPGDLRGADVAFNGAVARRLLAGEAGPVRDAVVVNAGAAIAAHEALNAPETVADDASLVDAIRAGMVRASDAISSGAASSVLDRWVELAGRLRAAA